MINDIEIDKNGNEILPDEDSVMKSELTIEEAENFMEAIVPKKKTKGIKAGVNVDYHTIMDKAKFVYSDWYEKMMQKKGEGFNLEDNILEKLSAKRKFGIKKYGDKSFQNSFDSSMTSPAKEHAKEELIDELNYLLHLHFVSLTTGSDGSLSDVDELEHAVESIKEVFNILESLETL